MLAHARDYSSNVTKHFLDASGIFRMFLITSCQNFSCFLPSIADIDDKLQLSPWLEGFFLCFCCCSYFLILHSAFAWVFFSWIKFHSLRRTLKKAEKILYITIQYILILFHNEFLNHISLQSCFMHSNMNLHIDCWCFVLFSLLFYYSLFVYSVLIHIIQGQMMGNSATFNSICSSKYLRLMLNN
jgi:hypothetical protein